MYTAFELEDGERELTAQEFANEVAGIELEAEAVSTELEAAQQALTQIEAAKIRGKKVSDTKYRAARNKRGDLESRLIALEGMATAYTLEGEKAFIAENRSAMEAKKFELGQMRTLKSERFRTELYQKIAELLALKYSLDGHRHSETRNALIENEMVSSTDRPILNKLIEAEMAKIPEEAPGLRIQAIESEMAWHRNRTGDRVLNFKKLVDDMKKELTNAKTTDEN